MGSSIAGAPRAAPASPKDTRINTRLPPPLSPRACAAIGVTAEAGAGSGDDSATGVAVASNAATPLSQLHDHLHPRPVPTLELATGATGVTTTVVGETFPVDEASQLDLLQLVELDQSAKLGQEEKKKNSRIPK